MIRFVGIFAAFLVLASTAPVHAASDLLDDSAGVLDDSTSSSPQPKETPVIPAVKAATAPAPKPSISSGSDSTGELFEGGEESLFDDESAAKKPKQGIKTDSGVAGSSSPAAAAKVDTSQHLSGSTADTGTASRPDKIVRQPVPVAKDSLVALPAIHAKVEDVRSINFAGNLKDYRSPKLAMLLSLILPGAGQAYAGNYVKTAIFGVIELGIIGASVAFEVKGKSETAKAHSYADQHFSADQFKAYYDALRAYFKKNDTTSGLTDQEIDSLAWLRINDIFFPTEGDTSFKSTFSRQVAGHSPDYYDNIQLKSFVQGWDDCKPSYIAIFNAALGTKVPKSPGSADSFYVHSDPDSGYLISNQPSDSLGSRDYGFSDNQITFGKWVSTANGYYRTGVGILYLLLLNHIGSAIDAGITAKQHNDKILGKQSFWQRIHLDPVCINSGTELAAGYAVRVSF